MFVTMHGQSVPHRTTQSIKGMQLNYFLLVAYGVSNGDETEGEPVRSIGEESSVVVEDASSEGSNVALGLHSTALRYSIYHSTFTTSQFTSAN